MLGEQCAPINAHDFRKRPKCALIGSCALIRYFKEMFDRNTCEVAVVGV